MEMASMFNKASKSVKKHSPEILTCVGAAGLIITPVLAVRATPRALILLEEKKREINDHILEEAKVNGEDTHDIVRVEKLHPLDVVRTTWKCYIPAVVAGTASIICFVGANNIHIRRSAALATACTISETALQEYRSKVIETIGEKKEKTVREAMTKDYIEKDPMSKKEIIITGKGKTPCYDVLSGRYFESDMETLRKAENEINRRMIRDTYISLNEFYYEIGLPSTKLGNDLGWRIDQDFIELRFDTQLSDDGTPCLVIDYASMPKYGYDCIL